MSKIERKRKKKGGGLSGGKSTVQRGVKGKGKV